MENSGKAFIGNIDDYIEILRERGLNEHVDKLKLLAIKGQKMKAIKLIKQLGLLDDAN